MITEHILHKASKVKLLICDVDGVLTNGQIIYDDRGAEYKIFHVHDGQGLKLLKQNDIECAIISSRASKAVTKRMSELSIEYVYQGQNDKLVAYQDLKTKLKLLDEQIAFVGDDLPDIPVMQQAGLGIAVENAISTVKENADWVTNLPGGKGAVREICELILNS